MEGRGWPQSLKIAAAKSRGEKCARAMLLRMLESARIGIPEQNIAISRTQTEIGFKHWNDSAATAPFQPAYEWVAWIAANSTRVAKMKSGPHVRPRSTLTFNGSDQMVVVADNRSRGLVCLYLEARGVVLA